MYVARFSYNIKPADRDKAIGVLEKEVAAARARQLEARLLIPLTRAAGGAALVVDVELSSLDQLEPFRESGLGTEDQTRAWLQELRALLLEPPVVELFRIDDKTAAS